MEPQRFGLANSGQSNILPTFGAEGLIYKGYTVNGVAGATQSYQLAQPGNMKRMVGIALFATDTGVEVTSQILNFLINSNKVLDQCPALAVCPQGLKGHVNNNTPFFFVNRELQGNDAISIDVTSTVSINLQLVIYYLPK